MGWKFFNSSGQLQTEAPIADNAITNAKLADDAVDSDEIAAGAIDLAHMSSQSVDEDNLYISNAGSDGQFLSKQSGNPGGLTWAAATFTGNLTGGQLTFPATQNASSTANVLDDYEEGTWTATFQEAGNDNTNASMVHTYGQYTKMGNRVFISFWAKSSSLVNVEGGMTIVGLPFPVKSGAQYYSTCDIGHASGLGTSNAIAAYFEPNTSLITLREWGGSDGTTNLTDGELSNDGALMGMGHYITTS